MQNFMFPKITSAWQWFRCTKKRPSEIYITETEKTFMGYNRHEYQLQLLAPAMLENTISEM